MSENDTLFGINFFVTNALTVPALFIPSVIVFTGPRYYRYYQFWMEHGLPLIAVYYMMFVHGKRPKYRHLWATVGLMVLLSIPCVAADCLIPGANYMYIGNFTDSSIQTVDPLAFLPHSLPLRYGILLAVVLALFHLLYGIERLIECRVKRKAV